MYPPNHGMTGVINPNSARERQISFSSYHPGGCNMALGDGTVRFFANEIDLSIWHAHASVAGGEVMKAQ